MIRTLKETDLNIVADIWLDTNLKAHDFISPQYWTYNFEPVKKLFSQAEMYIYEEDSKIQGFIGLNGDYIAGIFVRREAQSKGVGKQLLDFIKGIKLQLSLCVYQKNIRAIAFYQREDFEIQWEGIDKSTGEKEYSMIWK